MKTRAVYGMYVAVITALVWTVGGLITGQDYLIIGGLVGAGLVFLVFFLLWRFAR